MKVNQVQNSTTLDSEMTKEFYETIDKYIDQKLSEKDSQNDLVKENEADKDWGYWPYLTRGRQILEYPISKVSG